MQVLEEKEEKIAPGTLLGTSHTYAILPQLIVFELPFFRYRTICFFTSSDVPFSPLCSYVVGTGTQDKSGAKRVRVSPLLYRVRVFLLNDDISFKGYMFHILWLWHFQVDLLRGQKSDKVDVTLQPEELEAMENVLPAKYDFLITSLIIFNSS